MVILIPCYRPDCRLLELIDALGAPDRSQRLVLAGIVLVDDGSGPAFEPVFDAARAAGCDVIGYRHNRGKGRALKVGFAHVARHYPGQDVVCADCDGQHTPADIRRVGAALSQHQHTVVLGARRFVGNIPLRNRYGNVLTRAVYGGLTGQRLQDTQTGLRGYSASMLDWLRAIPGERYEYELEILLAARTDAIPVVEVPITTVYLDKNASSHFRMPWDPIRIYVQFLKFSASSLTSFVLDAALFFLFVHLTGSLVFSVAGARVASASANYAINERLGFPGESVPAPPRSGRRYAGVASVLVLATYTLIRMLTLLAAPLLVAKLATESMLFLVSHRAQRRYVFAEPRGQATTSRPTSTRSPSSTDSASRTCFFTGRT